MGKLILVLGEPGSGKSTAIKSLDPATTVVIKPNTKDLPFRGAAQLYNKEKKNVVICKEFTELEATLKAINAGTKVKTVVVEDLSHYLNYRVMKDSNTPGYQKWSALAIDCFNALIRLEDSLREDLYVFVIGHVSSSTDATGNKVVTLYTPGQLLENNIKIPSYFTYVMHTDVTETNGKMEYRFLTNYDGVRLAKSPEGCFDKFIPNDFKLVIDGIEKFQHELV